MSSEEKNNSCNEVIVNLTDEQQEQIKQATGMQVNVLKVEPLEDRATPMAILGWNNGAIGVGGAGVNGSN